MSFSKEFNLETINKNILTNFKIFFQKTNLKNIDWNGLFLLKVAGFSLASLLFIYIG